MMIELNEPVSTLPFGDRAHADAIMTGAAQAMSPILKRDFTAHGGTMQTSLDYRVEKAAKKAAKGAKS